MIKHIVINLSSYTELLQEVEAHDKKLEEQVTAMVEDTEKQVTKGFQHVAKFTQHMADWWDPFLPYINDTNILMLNEWSLSSIHFNFNEYKHMSIISSNWYEIHYED